MNSQPSRLDVQARILNIGCRLIGALTLLASASFLVGAAFGGEDWLLQGIAGLFALALGLAFLRVRPMRASDIQRWFGP